VIQEVFIRAFSPDARLAYDGRRDYAYYLAAVARHCLVDMTRARRREVLTAPEELPFEIETAPEPEGWCDGRTLQVLDGYLGGLDPILRSIYVKRLIDELSQVETALMLGITRRSVRTGERRLRAGLRKALIRAGIPVPRGLPTVVAKGSPGRLVERRSLASVRVRAVSFSSIRVNLDDAPTAG
jgi:RNA polymerase sigma-70 factor (ECF subfamily)